MNYLIDTNVLSERSRKTPESAVVSWFSSRSFGSLFISVLTFGELHKGIEKVQNTEKRLILAQWMDQSLTEYFTGRILPIDTSTADRWGRLQATAARSLPVIGSLLAATALRHNLTLVTRNIRDFADHGVESINPWNN